MINQHNLNSSRSPFKSRTEKWSGIKYNRRANCFKIICFSILIYANSLPLNSSLIEREKLLSLAGNIACDKTHQKKEPEKVILIFSFWMNHNELKKAPTLITNFFSSAFVARRNKQNRHHCTRLKSNKISFVRSPHLSWKEKEIVALTMFPCFLLLIELYSSFSFSFFPFFYRLWRSKDVHSFEIKDLKFFV